MTFKQLKASFIAGLVLLSVPGILCADNITKATYGWYSETYQGANIGSLDPNDPDRAYLGVWPSTDTVPLSSVPTVAADTTTFYEGSQSLSVTTKSGSTGGFYINFGTAGFIGSNFVVYKRARDFYNFGIGGSVDFDIKLDQTNIITHPADIHLKLEWDPWYYLNGSIPTWASFGQDTPANLSVSNYISDTGGWQHCHIPFSAINDVTDLYYFVNDPDDPAYDGIHYACITGVWAEANKRFWIDNIVWLSTATGSMSFTIKQRADNSVVANSSFTWSGIDLGNTKWKAADQYIEVKTDYYDHTWGMQIYTDNEAANANPKYTGTGNPAGLVKSDATTIDLPLAWRVTDSTTSALTVQQGTSGFPDRLWVTEQGSGYPCFLWMLDKSSSAFSGGKYNGAYTATVFDTRGIQQAEFTWSGAQSPNCVYIAADFSNAVTPATYTTNKLTVELYHE